MLAVTYLFVCGIILTSGHSLNTVKLRRIEHTVKRLQTEQEDNADAMNMMETNLTERMEKLESTIAANIGNPKVPISTNGVKLEPTADMGGFGARLEYLERNVEVIKNYLIGEKKIDKGLRKKSEEMIDQVSVIVDETEALVDSMKEHVKVSIDEFGTIVREVNASAHSRDVNVLGVVYYGGVGSTCSSGIDECIIARSECREGKCQCDPGLSYKDVSRSCVESCGSYGRTFQTVKNHIIRGYNNETIDDVSLADCKQKCFDEESFVCVSIDYFPRWRSCYLSEVTQSEVPEESWEYNAVGRHFQRDCA